MALRKLSPDLLVIGSGPGGYVAAIRASQLGLSTICLERESLLGGTCLREGCLPSGFLLNISKQVRSVGALARLGVIGQQRCDVDLERVQTIKDSVLAASSKGIEWLFSKYKVDLHRGDAVLKSWNPIRVDVDGKLELCPRRVILATGSSVRNLKGFEVDGKHIITSREFLSLRKIPQSLAVIGAGAVGLEMAQIAASFGSKVTVFSPDSSLGLDKDIAVALRGVLQRQGIAFRLGGVAREAVVKGSGVEVIADKGQPLKVECVLSAVGRVPYIPDSFRGLRLTAQGDVDVDPSYATSREGVYAIGDVISGPRLAHRASYDGIRCAEMFVGKRGPTSPIPLAIYTDPEVAFVGASAETPGAKVASIPFASVGRARIDLATSGLVKLVCDSQQRVIGLHVCGGMAGELVSQGSLAIQAGMTAAEFASVVRPHPSFSEAVEEAARVIAGGAVNF